MILVHLYTLPMKGVWKSRKPESGSGTGSGTGTGNGNGTGTVLWRGTDTRTGTSFILNYFNSDSIYTKNKKTNLVSCSPLNLFILRQGEGEKAASKINKATAVRVHRAFCQFSSPSMHNYNVNDQILSCLENVNGRRYILLCLSELGRGLQLHLPTFKRLDNLELMRNSLN